jgi:hypothetical protein
MMLFDPEVGLSLRVGNVAGREGGGREIMRGKECNSETEKKMYLRNDTWDEIREGSPCPRG